MTENLKELLTNEERGSSEFTWKPIYHEIAMKLLEWKDRQSELISFLDRLRKKDLKTTSILDKGEDGSRFPLTQIDPFTFMGSFNRGTTLQVRRAIIREVLKFFAIDSDPPSDLDGIPILNNQNSWFVRYKKQRKVDDIDRLWRVFECALQSKDPLNDAEFLKAFDSAMEVNGTSFNLTMGLFWIRPDTFLNLDQTNLHYLKITPPPGKLSSAYYRDTLRSVQTRFRDFAELSHTAWKSGESQPEAIQFDTSMDDKLGYWMLGAYSHRDEPHDKTQQFLEEGIWQNGYKAKYLDEVKSIQVGDMVAIKSSSTQKHNLPFESHGETISRMTIKAIGTVVANHEDGRTIEVEWNPRFEPKDWYFYTGRSTVWRLRQDEPEARRLIDFAFHGKPQDIDWFWKRWHDVPGDNDTNGGDKITLPPPRPYDTADMVTEGVFLSEREIIEAIARLETKKNLILQGPPGVGKTFIAKKLAYALMGEVANSRISMVQFHQSYSYEDFIRGYRPITENDGKFGLQNGIFFDFCDRAGRDPDNFYVFIIDEINRGNLSQIFGELLMLIEADKRGPDICLPLVYRKNKEPDFFVPENVFLIGLMNLADRSLAMVDYALRRRFAFLTLRPMFDSGTFQSWLRERGMAAELTSLIVNRLTALNQEITSDPLLGAHYQIGHSFFCPYGDNFESLGVDWYRGIIHTEILPLLSEYWVDDASRIDRAKNTLLA